MFLRMRSQKESAILCIFFLHVLTNVIDKTPSRVMILSERKQNQIKQKTIRFFKSCLLNLMTRRGEMRFLLKRYNIKYKYDTYVCITYNKNVYSTCSFRIVQHYMLMQQLINLPALSLYLYTYDTYIPIYVCKLLCGTYVCTYNIWGMCS